MTDKNRDAQANTDLEDTISKVVTLSPGVSTKDQDFDSGSVNDSEETTNAAFSLGRLEHDLKQLQSKWRAVEQEISDRDEKIAVLENAMDDDCQKISTLEADLELMSSRNDELSNQLGSAEKEIDEWRAKCDEFESELQSRHADLQLAQNEHDELLQGNRKLEEDLDQQRNDSAASIEAVNSLEAENAELRVRIQELQVYIDGRKREWEVMQSQLRDYENTIKGMSDGFGAHEDIVAGKEEEIAALAQTIMGLERDLAAQKGRQSEWDANRLEMQDALDRQGRELGSQSGQAAKLSKQIEDLEKVLSFHRDSDSQLQQKVDELEEKLEKASANAAREEIRAAELDAMLSELQVERRNLEKEVQAQRELVEVLEGEVQSKQENLNELDRSVNRISALGSEIRELDLLIDDRWHQQPDSQFEDSEDLFEDPDSVLIAPEELLAEDEAPTKHVLVAEQADAGHEIRYPLKRKEMTIGRGRTSDIRLQSKYISREHAKIKVSGEDVFVEDVGSTNGFLVNSVHATRHKLAHGDTVEFGKDKFRYLTVS